jgi:hypothetical protein
MADPKPNEGATPAPDKNIVADATAAKKAYDEVVENVTQIYRVGQARAIQTMWAMGRVVDEFLVECEKKAGSRYGSFGIDQLSDDLSKRDVGLTGRSSLYSARKVFKTLSFEQIETLAQRGYSTNHVKTLLPLSDEVREKVHAEMVDPKTNQIISVPALQEKVKSIQMDAAKAAADKAIDGPSPAEQIEAEADAGPAKPPQQTGEEAAQENGYTGENGEATTDAPEGEAATTPEGEPKDPEKAKLAAKGAPDFSKPPLPGVKKMCKTLQGFIGTVGDAVIALKEVPKVGFDSKVAAQNWVNAREELRASITDAEKYIAEMKKAVEESANSDGLADYLAPTGDDIKKRRKRRK